MRIHQKSWLAILGALLAGSFLLSGCASSASTTVTPGAGSPGAATATAAGPTTTPTPPPHALAWFQMDGSNTGQIWASVNGAAAYQVTHVPGSAVDCARLEHWSPPVFSPDLTKIVAAQGSAACSDGPETGPLYVVNATSGALTPVPSASVRLSLREAGWVNNTTVWWIDGQHLHEYVLGGASTDLGAITSGSTGSDDAVLRGSTLFFSTYASGATSFSLQRYDVSTHSLLAGSVNLGTTNPCECSRNDALTPGFDVSPDGSHIVYQHVSPVAGSGGDAEGVATSQFFYANADGSGASQIASYATANSMTRMQISPNGALVAIARAEPAPSVITASVTSPGHSGDPNLHSYSPDGRSYAVWKWDSSQVWASTKDLDDVYPPTTGDMENYVVGAASGVVGAAGGANPWYTIGG